MLNAFDCTKDATASNKPNNHSNTNQLQQVFKTLTLKHTKSYLKFLKKKLKLKSNKKKIKTIKLSLSVVYTHLLILKKQNKKIEKTKNGKLKIAAAVLETFDLKLARKVKKQQTQLQL